MVTLNEADRYLEAALTALRDHVDAVHVYDDRSTDDTVALAQDLGAVVSLRPPHHTSFAINEREMRQQAWEAFEMACHPGEDDWVLAVDADELLVAPAGLEAAIPDDAVSVVLPIPEVWGVEPGGTFRVRVDGWWKNLEAPRLFAYQAAGRIATHRDGCSSVPTYAIDGVQSRETHGVRLAHVGYVDADDRMAKFHRYYGQAGHSRAHIASIVTPAQTLPWPNPGVACWRGRR